MHIEVSKYEDKMDFLKEMLNIISYLYEGRKEREEYFGKKYPHLF